MHSNAAVARTRVVRKTSNGERRSIARKNRTSLRKLVKNREEFQLHLQFFGNCFDDKFRLANRIFYIDRGGNERERFVSNAGFDLSASDSLVERLPYPGRRLLKHAGRNVFEHGLVSAECGGIDNAPPHRARPNHSNALYVHSLRSPPRREIIISGIFLSLIISKASRTLLHQNPKPFANRE